jgi:hypothetical protein
MRGRTRTVLYHHDEAQNATAGKCSCHPPRPRLEGGHHNDETQIDLPNKHPACSKPRALRDVEGIAIIELGNATVRYPLVSASSPPTRHRGRAD